MSRATIAAPLDASSAAPYLERYEPFLLAREAAAEQQPDLSAADLRDMLNDSPALEAAVDVSFISGAEDAGEFQGDVVGRRYVSMALKAFLDLGEKQLEARGAGANFYLSQATVYASSSSGSTDIVEIVDLYDRLAAHPCSAAALSLVAAAEQGGSSLHQANLWLNTHAQTVSALHYDEYHNFLHVLSGKKQVVLLSPQHTPLLQAYAVSKDSCNRSRLDRQQLRRVVGSIRGSGSGGGVYEVDVCAGDVLFIPEGFWHLVASEPHTLAVNYWLLSPLRRLLDRVSPAGALDSYLLRQSSGALAQATLQAQLQPARLHKRGRSEWDDVVCSWIQCGGSNERGYPSAFEEDSLFSIPPDDLNHIITSRVLAEGEQCARQAQAFAELVRGLSPLGCHRFLGLLDSQAIAEDVGRRLMRVLNDADGLGGGDGVTRALMQGRERQCTAACRAVVEEVLFPVGGL